MTPQEQGKKKPLVPGCARPLNYKPTQSDLDYVGDLFPNALSDVNMRNGAVGYLTYDVARNSELIKESYTA